ncbi:Phage derived protein Gp49-like (DUF891) [Phyllobacterium sp. YR531]|nr:Phage derived protein Gp49-like (DUF891) [Phyllobacterium sp. YR531]
MDWDVRLHDAFQAEFQAFANEVQIEMLALAKLLAEFGPQLGRPYVDTLKGSKHANMKEMRFFSGRWRVANCLCLRPRAKRNPACCRR